MGRLLAGFLADESGATAIEYGMIAMLVAVGAILAFTTLGNSLVNLFGSTEQGAGEVFDTANGNF